MKNWNHWIFPWPHHNPTIYWAITRPSFNNPYMNQSNEGTPPPHWLPSRYDFQVSTTSMISASLREPPPFETSAEWRERDTEKKGRVVFFPGGCNVSRLLFQKSMWKGYPSWERWSRIPESTRSFQKSGKSSWDRVIHEKCIDLLLSLYPTNDKQPFPCLLLQRFPETWFFLLIMGDVHFICWVAGWAVWSQRG